MSDRERVAITLSLLILVGIGLLAINLLFGRSPAPAPRIEPAAGSGDPRAGRAVFVRIGCVECHAVRSVAEAKGTLGPALDGLPERAARRVPGMPAAAYVRQSVEQPDAFVVPGYLKAMPSLRDRMTAREFEDLMAFLMSLGERSAAPGGEGPR